MLLALLLWSKILQSFIQLFHLYDNRDNISLDLLGLSQYKSEERVTKLFYWLTDRLLIHSLPASGCSKQITLQWWNRHKGGGESTDTEEGSCIYGSGVFETWWTLTPRHTPRPQWAGQGDTLRCCKWHRVTSTSLHACTDLQIGCVSPIPLILSRAAEGRSKPSNCCSVVGRSVLTVRTDRHPL